MTRQEPTDETERTAGPRADRLLAYIADLELEVDRLRQQGMLIEREVRGTVLSLLNVCKGGGGEDPRRRLADVESRTRDLLNTLKELHDSPGYHPAHDQVVAIAVRPLAEQVFRWQQRLTGQRDVTLRLELEADHLEWFPARLRHILDNLFANALRHRDPTAPAQWLSLGLRHAQGAYEFRISDNGTGPPPGEDRRALEVFYRAAPIRAMGLGAGLAVVKLLVEQSGGRIEACPRDDSGTDFVLSLPRYDLLDYLE